MIWAILAILAIIALFCFGRAMYQAGAENAALEQKKAEEKGREYVQSIVDANAGLSDSELDEWLRRRQNKQG